MHDPEVRERVERLETLLERIEGQHEALEAVQALVQLYGEALDRLVNGADPAADELVSHLLLVHGIHPRSVEERVQTALDGVRPYLDSHGGDVELVGVESGVAHLKLVGTCDGCPSSAATLKLAVEEAVLGAAPELERVEAEGVVEQAPQPAFVPIDGLTCPPGLVGARSGP